MEAKVVMDIAQVDGTTEFPLIGIKPNNLAGAQRGTVDLNDVPFRIQEEHLNRLKALSRTGIHALCIHTPADMILFAFP